MWRGQIKIKGYLSVEAALIMPLVFLCYFVIVIYMCSSYERCIWEQNACRMPIWVKFWEGEEKLYLNGKGELSEREMLEYAEQWVQEEEKTKYLFGSEVSAQFTRKGNAYLVERGIVFSVLGKHQCEFQQKVDCSEPVAFLRTARKIEGAVQGEGREDDKE